MTLPVPLTRYRIYSDRITAIRPNGKKRVYHRKKGDGWRVRFISELHCLAAIAAARRVRFDSYVSEWLVTNTPFTHIDECIRDAAGCDYLGGR